MQAHIPSDIQSRITRVANELFEQSGRQAFPTVDLVRRTAKVDMNAASTVMKEWRRAQTSQVAPVAVQVPEPIAQLYQQTMLTSWTKAQELANESLRSAQAGWDTEREELDAMRQELVEAFETQAAELEQIKGDAIQAAQTHEAAAKLAADELSALRIELAQATTRAERAEAKVGEIERRASDLHAELERAHLDGDKARASLDELTTALRAAQDAATVAETEKQAEIKVVREEVTRAREESKRLQQEASQARETSARMQGELETLRSQNTAFLATLKPVEKAPGAPKKARSTGKDKQSKGESGQ